MKQYQHILFDLDGTLSDPKIGITKSVQYALKQFNINEENLDNLECFIGPPLQVSFKEYYGMNDKDISLAIEYYRERFKDKGTYENVLYPEIPGLLESLKEKGCILDVATTKPTVFAEEIVQYFEIDHFFNHIVGSHLDGTRSIKGEVIEHALNMYNQDLDEFIMIGDRKHDLIGANSMQIDSIGVTYGYGSYDELYNEKPTHIVNNIKQLRDILISG
ncbi:HAD hydrolase-like protein [Corticicoccus populi]|uniref:HAD hydrolase-like protein n=1 Tax=Corticicoccus populi TaxID=1812821 RepID=A0ABW5WTM1_9STAP